MRQAEAKARATEDKGPAQGRRRAIPSWIPDRGPGLVVFVIAAILLLISLVAASVRTVEYRRSRADLRKAAETRALADLERAASAVGRDLSVFTTTIDDLAADLAAELQKLALRGVPDPISETLGDRIPRDPPDGEGLPADAPECEVAESESPPGTWQGIEYELCARAALVPNINGLMAAYNPTGPQGAYQPYAQITDGVLKLRYPNVERVNDGKDESLDEYWGERDYLKRALIRGGQPVWTRPRFGVTSRTMLAWYNSAVWLGTQPVAVVGGTLTLDRLADDISFVEASAAGYPFIFREDDQGEVGIYVNHPEPSRYRCAQRLDGAEPDPRPGLPDVCTNYEYVSVDLETQALMKQLFDGGVRNDRGILTGYSDVITGEPAIIAYAPVAIPSSTEVTSPSPPWTLALVTYENEVLARTERQTQLLIEIGLFVLLGLLAITVLIVRPRGVSNTRLWVVAAATAVFALLGIGWIWYLVATAPRAQDPVATTGEVVEAPSTYIDDGTSVVQAGVFLQGIDFRADEGVVVQGRAWQEYRQEEAAAYRAGFQLPEAAASEFIEQNRGREGPVIRISWRFTATLPQTFDARRYPFDQTDVWLRLWPSDLTVETILIPDLPQYQILAPLARPGLEVGYEVDGWNIQGSYFSHRRNTYNTNPGPLEWIDQDAGEYKPELYFT
ncbi:MAG: hypothetical protein ACE5MI_08850, partial [Acidimicrobiia bacterium]